MSWFERLNASLRGRRLEEELERELDFHLNMRIREKVAAGADPESARLEVMRRFGSVARTKEDCRQQSTFAWLTTLRQDLRYAARNLRTNPGFTAAAVACLAIGIGANTVVFSFVNAFLFQPAPGGVYRIARASGNMTSFPEWQEWRRLNGVFDRTFAYSMGTQLAVGRGVESRRFLGETVAGDYFQTLGVTPAAGRLLEPSDESTPAAVIGSQLWRNRFHSDPSIAGQTVWIENQPVTIVGVAPAGFQGMMAPWSTEVWATPALHPEQRADRRLGWLEVAGHLKSGLSRQQATAAMNILDRHLDEANPTRRTTPDPLVLTRPGLATSSIWNVFTVMSALLMAVVGIIYLIACANVAGLLVARAAARRRETLIRLSVGASRPRLIRQLLTESLLLGLLGATLGTALAYVAGNGLAAAFPQSISHGFAFQHTIDFSVLTWTLTLAVASVVFAGLLPALRASRENLAVAGRTQGGFGDRTPRLRQGLVVAQVAASVLVLATAGVFVRSFQKSHELKPGFDAVHVLTVALDLSSLHGSSSQAQDFCRKVKKTVAELPGIESASLTDVLPLGDEHSLNIPNFGAVATATVDGDYFRTFGIPLVQGREPGEGEENVWVMNQALADRWRRQTKAVLGEIVGVAANSKYWSLTESPRPFVYRIVTQFERQAFHLAVRTKGPAADFALPVSRAIQNLSPDLPLIVAQTGEQRLRAWVEPQRAAALLLGVLGFAALALAITGLYALIAQLLVQRTGEIAVRVALGATRRRVLQLLLGQSAILMASGTALGIGAAGILARLLASGMGAIGTLDAPTLATIVLLLAAIAGAATAIPAYRALRIDPASALKSD